MNKVRCDIVKDLLPLYIDDILSESSKDLVEEHIKICSDCQKDLESYNKKIVLPMDTDIEPLKKISYKFKIQKLSIALLISIIILFLVSLIIEPFSYDKTLIPAKDSITDIMYYYGMLFVGYYFAFAIVATNVFKSIYVLFIKQKQATSNTLIKTFDIVTSILSGLILASGLYFQGILADNSAPNIDFWSKRLFIISIVSFILFIVQVILYSFNRKDTNQIK
nr:zf-HC2 domain-containing protein [Tissierella sp.]